MRDPFVCWLYADDGFAYLYFILAIFFRVPQKQRPRKRRPQTADLGNADLKCGLRKLNTDPEKGQHIVCVLIVKFRS